eukprot:271196-Pleurochrysis_carterae.AAC.2
MTSTGVLVGSHTAAPQHSLRCRMWRRAPVPRASSAPLLAGADAAASVAEDLKGSEALAMQWGAAPAKGQCQRWMSPSESLEATSGRRGCGSRARTAARASWPPSSCCCTRLPAVERSTSTHETRSEAPCSVHVCSTSEMADGSSSCGPPMRACEKDLGHARAGAACVAQTLCSQPSGHGGCECVRGRRSARSWR